MPFAGKGAGVIGAEIWVKVDGPPLTQRVPPRGTDRAAITERSSVLCVKGPPPVDPGELEFLAVDTRGPLHARLRRGGGRQERQLSFALGEPDRREGTAGP
jgi:hypothetical protein